MSLTTSFAIASPFNHEMVFMAARRIIGIPAEQPFEVGTDPWGDERIFSIPGCANSALIMYHHNGLPISTDSEDTSAPVMFLRVSFDTQWDYEGPEGDATGLHRRLTAELGAWCDRYGLDWWTSDEGAEWVRGAPAYERSS